MADVNLTHTGAELDAAIAKVTADFADVSVVTAAAGDVITGKIFVDATGEPVTGTNDGSGDTSDATANAGQILEPYTAYVAAGKVTGVMPNNAGDVAAASYHRDGTSLHIVPAEGYTDGSDDAVVITDAEFLAENIKSGVNIFGIDGAMEGGTADSIVITAVNANKRITGVDLSSMTEIYPYMFKNYASNDGIYIYLVNVTLPDTIEIIGASAFYNCTVMTLEELPADLTTIGASAFQTCSGITISELPSGVTSVGSSAFVSCNDITSMTIPASLTVIPTSMFSYCTDIATLNLPTTLETINNTAFRRLTSLAKVWISITCTTIAAASYSVAPFYECSSTLVLYCEAESKPAGWGTYYNYYGNGTQLTVNWGVSKATYDAL